MTLLNSIHQDLHALRNKEKAKLLSGFFKTGSGQYGEGDIFLGLTMPQIRIIATKYFDKVSLSEAQELVKSEFHECRMCALVMLVYKYEKYTSERKTIFDFFLNNTKYINPSLTVN
ncbi:hypothetical protein COV17_02850 [Candidatus Woesearchaeota archaeon CG10_big_fil_rev_8_21_14_0_10_36_11]|nr:MAG: hypothetical protein COV17_02850 [Candidatus Woesearchaeota archaeon CG10_big_fil_rev_8_21_14_0_10_36_11]